MTGDKTSLGNVVIYNRIQRSIREFYYNLHENSGRMGVRYVTVRVNLSFVRSIGPPGKRGPAGQRGKKGKKGDTGEVGPQVSTSASTAGSTTILPPVAHPICFYVRTLYCNVFVF